MSQEMKFLGIKLPNDLLALLKARAKEEGRPLSNMARIFLRQGINTAMEAKQPRKRRVA